MHETKNLLVLRGPAQALLAALIGRYDRYLQEVATVPVLVLVCGPPSKHWKRPESSAMMPQKNLYGCEYNIDA